MQMTIVFKSADATLSASVEVADQNEAKRVAADLYAQTTKLQNGHLAELTLRGWTANLAEAQAAKRLADILGLDLAAAKRLMKSLPKDVNNKLALWPVLYRGTLVECQERELKLRDHGIQAACKRLGT
jgi:hypothetical protein